jgi:hypothetical protein
MTVFFVIVEGKVHETRKRNTARIQISVVLRPMFEGLNSIYEAARTPLELLFCYIRFHLM